MIYLAIGSNLSSKHGDRFKNITLAIDYIEENNIKILKKSSFYETPSYPDKKNPKFINVVIIVETKLSPKDLMLLLINIEKKFDRKRNKKNEPRTCDIDIIDYNKQILKISDNQIDLILPHEKTTHRNFVLYPLSEISPNWKHPVSNAKVNSLIQKLPDLDKKSVLKLNKS